MKAIWYTKKTDFDYYILGGDIGGTNTNLAIVGKSGDTFSIVLECIFDSHKQTSLLEPIQTTLKEAGPALAPSKCCISAAGPVKNNFCQLTNQSWSIDGYAIQKTFSIPTLVINDFLGLSYGIPLLDVDNAESITKIPSSDNKFPDKHGDTCCIVGAGTGLGVGCVTKTSSSIFAIPTEGGHIDFAAFDEQSFELIKYLNQKNGIYPDAESIVSGQGLNNIFDFFVDRIISSPDEETSKILSEQRKDRPPLISMASSKSRQLRDVMDLFVKCYGKVASNLCLTYLATGGVYLAGGIATKNEKLFIENNLFASYFKKNMRSNFCELLSSIPVYIVRDYNTSLLGAANAGDIIL